MKITKAYLKKLIKEEINDLQVVVENKDQDIQDIVNLISGRISKVGFGDEDEEDFLAAKVELKEDLDEITFEQWQALSGENQYKENKMKITNNQRG